MQNSGGPPALEVTEGLLEMKLRLKKQTKQLINTCNRKIKDFFLFYLIAPEMLCKRSRFAALTNTLALFLHNHTQQVDHFRQKNYFRRFSTVQTRQKIKQNLF